MMHPDDALAVAFRAMAPRLAAAQADLPTVRAILEELHVQTAEPVGVTYEEMVLAGQPALWARPTASDERSVLLYFHGGGFTANSIHSHRKLAGHLARSGGCHALLPAYRLSPEAVFPAALNDATSVYEQLLDSGFAPERLVLAGDSAGANLAVATTLRLRDDGRPLPAALVCLSPWFDLEVTGPSLVTNAEVDFLVARPAVVANAQAYLGRHSPTDPLVNPLYADPSGLPPIYLAYGGHEAFRDNGERFGASAETVGVDVTIECAPGMQHDYVLMAGRAPAADRTVDAVGRWLRTKLAP